MCSTMTGAGIGKGGTSTLFVDGTQVATGKVGRKPCCAVGIKGMEVAFDIASRVTEAIRAAPTASPARS